ncbi:MAG: hypothetical protein FJ090_19540 [Deltaproteobacteria bacterium]|nr:hypothetical protein [Deltaproteobacteria bacterium]
MRLLLTTSVFAALVGVALDKAATQAESLHARARSMQTAEQMGLESQSAPASGARKREVLYVDESSYPSGQHQRDLWKERTERALRGEPIFEGHEP